MLPPVLLAALFIWLWWAQMKHMEHMEHMDSVGNFLAGYAAGEGADARTEPSLPDAGVVIGPSGGAGRSAGEEAGANGTNSDGIVPDGMAPEAGPEGAPGSGVAPDRTAADSVTLLFAGDIYLSSHVLNAYDKAGGISGVLDAGLRSAIGAADIFMANEEFPFSDRGTAAEEKEYTFRLPTARVSLLQEIGPDIVALANNHAFDYGEEALLDTCRVLDGAGILRVGAGADIEEAKALRVIETKGRRIGFLAASRVIPDYSWAAGKGKAGMMITYDPAALIKEIERAEDQCDYLVVYVHWGIEKNEHPEEYQRTLGRQYIDAGADIVVGSHPHVLQGIEYYKGKPIVYSLGNFVFGSTIPRTALLEVRLSADAFADASDGQSLRLIPCTSSAGYTRMLPEEKRPEFFGYMEELSFGVSVDETGGVTAGKSGGVSAE